jgi:hypothetical protein
MTTYKVHFRNSTAWASHDITAKTPEMALALARKYEAQHSIYLRFEAYDITSDVNEIVVSDERGNELASWYDEELTLRLAAPDLLGALETLAFEAERRAGVPKTYVAKARTAIAKAKGGAA